MIEYKHYEKCSCSSCRSLKNAYNTFNKLLNNEISVNAYRGKLRSIVLNYKGNFCSICGLKPYWQNKKLVLILDHIDGNASNNSLINIKFVCPNCDSQLDTYKSKNKNSSRQRNIIKIFDKYCKCCNEKFETSKSSQIYCSNCLNKLGSKLYYKQNKIKKTKKTRKTRETKKIEIIKTRIFKKTCLKCGKRFSAKLTNKKRNFCSRSCGRLSSKLSYDVLLNDLLLDLPLSKIAKKYDLTDNAYKKQLKKYNLPWSKNDRKLYRDNYKN